MDTGAREDTKQNSPLVVLLVGLSIMACSVCGVVGGMLTAGWVLR